MSAIRRLARNVATIRRLAYDSAALALLALAVVACWPPWWSSPVERVKEAGRQHLANVRAREADRRTVADAFDAVVGRP